MRLDYRICGIVACAWMVSSVASADVITIHDQTFTNGTWTSLVYGGANVTSTSVSRQAGTGVTGDTLVTTVQGTGSYTFDVADLYIGRPFVPSTEGVIQSVRFDLWHKTPAINNVGTFKLAARQNGSLYVVNTTSHEPPSFLSSWQHYPGAIDSVAGTMVLAPTDFTRVTGSGPATLAVDLSAPPIEFGFAESRGFFQSGTTTFNHSFYTVELTVTPAPEPTTALAVAGAVFVLWARRRRGQG